MQRGSTDRSQPALFATALLLCTILPAGAVAAPQVLRVTHVRLDNAGSASRSTGALKLRAVIDDTASNGSLAADLLGSRVVIRVKDASSFDVRIPLTRCRRTVSTLRCDGGHWSMSLKPTTAPFVHRVRFTARRLPANGTGTTRPVGPVRITLRTIRGPSRVDVISDCTPITAVRLECRDRNRPNIVFVVTDDQRSDTLQYMERTVDRLAHQGVVFTNAFVTTPSCAPSRVSMLTGQYARHHGVLTVGGPQGGATRFVGGDASTLATSLHAAGYRTGMYGKYITGYAGQCPPYTGACYIPPGWDEWHVLIQEGYFNYQLAENQQIATFGSAASDYSTDVIGAKAVEFILGADGQPFFLHIGFNAPHQNGGGLPIPAPRHDGVHAEIPPWRPPSHGENVADKPSWFTTLPRSDTWLAGFLTYGVWGDAIRTKQAESLAAVDEAIDAILDALEATGQTDNTVVVFTSDNGHMWGEHRFFWGKGVPYEESIRVPLIIRYPRLVSGGRTDTHLALNIDLAPTLTRLAGVEPPASVDGLSLDGVLANPLTPWRSDFVVEWWDLVDFPGLTHYAGLRSEDWKYVSYPSAGEAELYDLVDDSYELDNRIHDPSYGNIVSTAQSRLDELLAD